MTENKQYITNNPHNKSYIFCDSVRLNNIEVAKTLNELATKFRNLEKKNEQLKQQLFETSKELLWATSDEVDRALYYEDEVEELRKEIFE